jgi:hypothetical protein
VGDERAVRSRPRHPVGGGDLGHGPRRITDRCADLGAQPSGGPSPARDLWDRFGKRSPPTIILPTPPPRLVPPHDDSILAVRNVAGRRPYPGLHRPIDNPTRRTRRGRFLRCHHIHHTSPVRRTLNTYSWQPEQQCHPSNTALGSLLPSESVATLRLRKAKGLPMQRHALSERNHNCPTKIEEPLPSCHRFIAD